MKNNLVLIEQTLDTKYFLEQHPHQLPSGTLYFSHITPDKLTILKVLDPMSFLNKQIIERFTATLTAA